MLLITPAESVQVVRKNLLIHTATLALTDIRHLVLTVIRQRHLKLVLAEKLQGLVTSANRDRLSEIMNSGAATAVVTIADASPLSDLTATITMAIPVVSVPAEPLSFNSVSVRITAEKTVTETALATTARFMYVNINNIKKSPEINFRGFFIV